MTGDDDATSPAGNSDATGSVEPTHDVTTPGPRDRAPHQGRTTWKRVVTGIASIVVLVASAFALSASGPNTAQAGSSLGPALPPLPSGPLTAPSPTNPNPVSVGTAAQLGLLVNPIGKTLYFNDQDTATNIQCVGSCARVWHPLKVTDAAALTPGPGVLGTLGTVDRPDGGQQVTYNGHPIYTFTIDSVGHVTGDGTLDSFDGVAFSWHAATATGEASTSAPIGPSGSPSGPSGAPTPPPGQPTPTPAPTPPAVNPTRGA